MKKNSLFTQTLTASIITFLVFFSFVSTKGMAATSNQDLDIEFKESPCEFELPANMIEGQDIKCGFITVPQNRADSEGATLQLAVAILKSKDQSPAADPLFMAQGGPGGSTIDSFLQQFTYNTRLRNNRDIVLLEQRGTLNSIPNLMCTEIDQLMIDTLEKDLSPDELAKLNLQALEECRNRLIKDGIDLASFNSLENAADIESLRIALGYDQINLYGVSYGSLLALHYMNRYPDHLRSVILDGVLPPQINFLTQTTYTIDQSLKKLFAACQADAACNREYPDLERTFFDLVNKLNENPAIIPMTDPDSGKTYQAVIDGDSFLNSISQMLYATSIIPALPRVIYDARDGEFDFFRRILELIVFDRTMAYGMYYSVLCTEDADFTPAEQNLSGIHPMVQEILQRGPKEFLDSCQVWDVRPLKDSVDDPVTSDIPTLLLSGAFDPVTPAEYAEAAAQSLKNSYEITFPEGGHGQAFEDQCQDQMILNFLENPSKAPDDTCVAEDAGPKFYTSKNVIDTPVVVGLLNLESSAVIQFLTLLVSTICLSTAILVIPISGLVRWVNRPKDAVITDQPATAPAGKDSFLIRMMSWDAFLAGVLAVLFLIGFIAALIMMVASNDNRLIYGLMGEIRPLLLIPPLLLLLTLGWLAGIIQAWKIRSGSIWKRIYHTFLLTNAVLTLMILGFWGLLFGII